MRYWKTKHIAKPYKVGIGVAAYLNEDERHRHALRCLVASFQAQTWQNWKMLIVHDGPVVGAENDAVLNAFEVTDKRVVVVRTPERLQQFGHPHRQLAIDSLTKECDWITLTNQDNYYVPVFVEWLLFAGTATPGCGLVHCDMVHSHKNWKPLVTEPRYKHLDLGGFMVKSSVAAQVPFDNFAFNGDGDWINRLVSKVRNHVQHVPATLFVHN